MGNPLTLKNSATFFAVWGRAPTARTINFQSVAPVCADLPWASGAKISDLY
jgi:hypothetical protein